MAIYSREPRKRPKVYTVHKRINFSQDEWETLEAQMTQEGFKLFSTFARRRLLEGKGRSVSSRHSGVATALDNLTRAFNRIGKNYNMFVRNTLHLSKFTNRLGIPVITSDQVLEATDKLSRKTDELKWSVERTEEFIRSSMDSRESDEDS